ncbi:MAG: recombination protein RecR [Bacteroidales bacterium]|jgi:recombination protein RecR|nr:recombination mediator RecR [Bacteroidales bacterium]MCK9499692.1 recombination mediator RecR [Bacteroidales bacterium]MDY0314583.1 recombination mediator RecR [Bacteroidales bacterium]NLB87265.1 recombination protein RecR [Bacteroidales bacterium]
MRFDNKSGKFLEDAIMQFSSLPGIGKKTALRFALHLLRRPETEVENFANSILSLKKDTKFCTVCNNISDNELCSLCSDKTRDFSKICIVEGIHDIMALESTSQYNGLYHVLGGVISPMEGISPSDLNLANLFTRLDQGNIQEVIFALPATMEGDTTNYFINRKIENKNIEITVLARGVAIGDELQYTDEITLGQSIINRKPFTK